MFTKKKTCGVCGYRATPTKEAIYVAEEPRGFMEALTKPPTRFNAMDCPRCGCQIQLAIRFQRVELPQITEREKKLASAAEPEQYSLNVDPATGEIVEGESEAEE